MTYLSHNANIAFGIYDSEVLAELAVNTLVESGFGPERISVLMPNNEATRNFALKLKTHVPEGVSNAPTANLPLNGTGGFLDLWHEPREGALPSALRDMGVPADWCNRRVVDGQRILLAIKADSWDQLFRALGILQYTLASDQFWALSEENYRYGLVPRA